MTIEVLTLSYLPGNIPGMGGGEGKGGVGFEAPRLKFV